MKKLSSLLASFLALGLLLTGCGASGGSSSSSSLSPAGNGAKGELIMATEASFAPYEYYRGNEIVGVDVDIARSIAQSMGYELRVVDMDFAAALAAVNSGKADLAAAGISITDERREQVDFSIEYATSKQILLVREDSGYVSLEDLNGKAIGVQLGTVADLELEDNHPQVTVRQYNKYNDALNDLKNGRIEAIAMDILPAQELVQESTGLKILEKEFLIDSYAIAVKKGNAELLDSINLALNKLVEDGKIAEFTINHTTGRQ